MSKVKKFPYSKYQFIDPDYYLSKFKEKDWYLKLQPEIERLLFSEANKNKKEEKEKLYRITAAALKSNGIYLASAGENWDDERKTIDTVVIHHTSTVSNLSLTKLSAIGLLRLYCPRYWARLGRPVVRGQPVWSGHFHRGRQVFYAYHWLVRKSGKVQHILDDGCIGWHAGNWEINCRSIGIALVGDYFDRDPSSEVLKSCAEIIKGYKFTKAERIFGHQEIVETICPGKNFRNWKRKLLGFV